MRLFIVLLSLLVWRPALAGLSGPGDEPAVVFSMAPALQHSKTEVSVGRLKFGPDSGEFWFHKLVQQFGKPAGPPEWTDTWACPQARGVLASLTKSEMPKPGKSGRK